MSLSKWQAKYMLAAAALLPVSPALYLQGQITRMRVGVLPDAEGPREGRAGEGIEPASMLALGESTVAGLGARNHELAFAGQFARFLSESLERPVEWSVVGKNGVTARRTIDELVPMIPEREHDFILLGLGGNDVMKLSSPKKWRRDMLELLGILREANPGVTIFISNCPMIKHSPAIPQPIRGILWELSMLHDANIREFTADMERVYYYPQPVEVPLEGFFSDGLHPSEQGYRDWARAMMDYFNNTYEWKPPTS